MISNFECNSRVILTHQPHTLTKPSQAKMRFWTTQPVLNEHRTKRVGTIYTYDGRKNIHNKYYYNEIKSLQKAFLYDDVEEIEEELEDGHIHIPRKFDYDEDYNEDYEKERLGHHLNKYRVNCHIFNKRFLIQVGWDLKNVNKRKMNETLGELKNINDDPNTLLGKLCLRQDALEIFPEWDADDFPNIPSYA